MYGRVKDDDGSLIPNVPIYFFEKYDLSSINVSSSKNPIQLGDNEKLYGRVKDEDGSLIPNVPVYFFESIRPSYTNDGTSTSDLIVEDGASVTVDNNSLRMTGSSSTKKRVSYPYDITSSSNILFECEIARIGTGDNPIRLFIKEHTFRTGCILYYYSGKWHGSIGTYQFSNVNTGTLQVGDIIRIEQNNNTVKFYHNDTVIASSSVALDGTYKLGHACDSYSVQYIKNVKIYNLDED